jgi:hypothetical protein
VLVPDHLFAALRLRTSNMAVAAAGTLATSLHTSAMGEPLAVRTATNSAVAAATTSSVTAA